MRQARACLASLVPAAWEAAAAILWPAGVRASEAASAPAEDCSLKRSIGAPSRGTCGTPATSRARFGQFSGHFFLRRLHSSQLVFLRPAFLRLAEGSCEEASIPSLR